MKLKKQNHIDASLAESIKQKAINLGLYATNMPVEYGGRWSGYINFMSFGERIR